MRATWIRSIELDGARIANHEALKNATSVSSQRASVTLRTIAKPPPENTPKYGRDFGVPKLMLFRAAKMRSSDSQCGYHEDNLRLEFLLAR